MDTGENLIPIAYITGLVLGTIVGTLIGLCWAGRAYEKQVGMKRKSGD